MMKPYFCLGRFAAHPAPARLGLPTAVRLSRLLPTLQCFDRVSHLVPTD